jgi:hypothetical protein
LVAPVVPSSSHGGAWSWSLVGSLSGVMLPLVISGSFVRPFLSCVLATSGPDQSGTRGSARTTEAPASRGARGAGELRLSDGPAVSMGDPPMIVRWPASAVTVHSCAR